MYNSISICGTWTEFNPFETGGIWTLNQELNLYHSIDGPVIGRKPTQDEEFCTKTRKNNKPITSYKSKDVMQHKVATNLETLEERKQERQNVFRIS
jgi:hypothetical protein